MFRQRLFEMNNGRLELLQQLMLSCCGGVGFVVGTRDQRAGHQADSQKVVGASVGSVIGEVNLVATRG